MTALSIFFATTLVISIIGFCCAVAASVSKEVTKDPYDD